MTKYEDFIDAYRSANPQVSKKVQYEQAIKIWKELKKDPASFEEKIEEENGWVKTTKGQKYMPWIENFQSIKIEFWKKQSAWNKSDTENSIENKIVASTSNSRYKYWVKRFKKWF